MEIQENNQANISASALKNHKGVEIIIIMPTHAYFLSGIRDFTLNLIRNMTAFSEKWAYRFQSIVDELCNNAIEHGSKEGENIKVIFKTEPNEYIQISVEDSGTAVPHMKANQILSIVKERSQEKGITNMIRGRGLPKIVAEWTDELNFVDTDRGGILVTVKKYLKDESLTKDNNLENNHPNRIILN